MKFRSPCPPSVTAATRTGGWNFDGPWALAIRFWPGPDPLTFYRRRESQSATNPIPIVPSASSAAGPSVCSLRTLVALSLIFDRVVRDGLSGVAVHSGQIAADRMVSSTAAPPRERMELPLPTLASSLS